MKRDEAHSAFRETVVDIIGLTAWNTADFEAWWASAPETQRTHEAIAAHVMSLPSFVEKHAALFERMYSAWHDGSSAPVAATQLYLEKTRKDPIGYDVGSLQADLEAGMYRAVAAPLAKPPPSTPQGFDARLVLAFEGAAGRPMFVHEYFKYRDDPPTDWAALLKHHRTNLARMQGVWSAYTGRTLHEYEYVARFLFVVDNADFFTRIVDELCASSMYTECMRSTLSSRYAALYGRDMPACEVEHLLRDVRKEKLTVRDDALDARVVEFKELTDSHNQATTDTFQEVLGRDPDEQELARYLAMHRAEGATVDEVTSTIEDELVDSLEFHDVIKAEIRAQGGPSLPARCVFSALSTVLSSSSGMRRSELTERVKQALLPP
jgi:hypothetical protein